MSNELSIFEAMGGTYRTVDGILYPNISECSDNTLSVTITDLDFLYERKSYRPIPPPYPYGAASS